MGNSVSHSIILTAVAPVFLTLGLGFLSRHFHFLKSEADASLTRLVINIFYPALILHAILNNKALEQPENLMLAPAVGFVLVTLGFLLAYLLAPLLGLQVGSGRRSFSFSAGLFNYGFIPIPIIVSLFDADRTLGVLFLHNLGVEVAFWTVGVVMLRGKINLGSAAQVLKPPIVAVVLGIVLNLTGVDAHTPGWVTKTLAFLAPCSVPLGMMLAGAVLRDLVSETNIWSQWRVPAGTVFLRLLLMPVIMLTFARYFAPLSNELVQVIVVQAAMPAALFPIVVTRYYRGETKIAAMVVVSTTLLSLLTIPLWIALGLWYAV